MKDDRASFGLQPGNVIDVAFDRPGTFSKISWQPMSLTSRVPRRRRTMIYERLLLLSKPSE